MDEGLGTTEIRTATMKTLFLMLLLSLAMPAFAGGYRTHCNIVDGEAQGWVVVDRFASIEYDGDVTFIFYDEDWDIIDEDTSWDWHWHYSGADLAETEDAPDDAVACDFDISAANPVVED